MLRAKTANSGAQGPNMWKNYIRTFYFLIRLLFNSFFDQNFGQVFDQGFDQGVGEGVTIDRVYNTTRPKENT